MRLEGGEEYCGRRSRGDEKGKESGKGGRREGRKEESVKVWHVLKGSRESCCRNSGKRTNEGDKRRSPA